MAKILVADDEEAVRAYMARALAHHGHEVDVVADGGAALHRLREGAYDLLLADIAMPVMDGVALALKVAAQHPQVKVLLMTGYVAERQRAHNLDEIVHDVLAKPVSLDAIGAAVAKALAS